MNYFIVLGGKVLCMAAALYIWKGLVSSSSRAKRGTASCHTRWLAHCPTHIWRLMLNVPLVQCAFGAVWLWCTVSLVQCAFVAMWLWCTVPLVQCDFGALWLWCTVHLVQCAFVAEWLWCTVPLVQCTFCAVCLLCSVPLVQCDFGAPPCFWCCVHKGKLI